MAGVLWQCRERKAQAREPAVDDRFCTDPNGDGNLDLSDAMSILNYIFIGGEAPYCIAQDLTLDDRFVNEAQPASVAEEMLVDGSVSSAKLHPEILERLARLDELETRLGQIEAGMAAFEPRVPTQEEKEALGHVSIVQLDNGVGGQAKTVRFTGVNVQIVNGLGATNGVPGSLQTAGTQHVVNSVGNLILGYQESLRADPRTGSHNLVVGPYHSHSSVGGVVFGLGNRVEGLYASVVGGEESVASGVYSAVSGGKQNRAPGTASAVSGGFGNSASGAFSSVGGGFNNTASGRQATVSGARNS